MDPLWDRPVRRDVPVLLVDEPTMTSVAQEDWDDLREANKVLTQSVKDENAAALKAMAERDTWRQRAEEAEEVVGSLTQERDLLLSVDIPRQELAAAERTVREQREVLERAEKEWAVALVAGTNGDPDLILAVTTKRIELREAAALAPNTEGDSDDESGGKWWRYPDVSEPRECGCTQWWDGAEITNELREHNRHLRAALVKAEAGVAALDDARGNQEDYLGELERERDHAKHMHMMADQSAVDAWAWGKKMERQRDENADIIATWRQRAEEAEEVLGDAQQALTNTRAALVAAEHAYDTGSDDE